MSAAFCLEVKAEKSTPSACMRLHMRHVAVIILGGFAFGHGQLVVGLFGQAQEGLGVFRAALLDKDDIPGVQQGRNGRLAGQQAREHGDGGAARATLFHHQRVGGRVLARAVHAHHGQLDGGAVRLFMLGGYGHVAAVGNLGDDLGSLKVLHSTVSQAGPKLAGGGSWQQAAGWRPARLGEGNLRIHASRIGGGLRVIHECFHDALDTGRVQLDVRPSRDDHVIAVLQAWLDQVAGLDRGGRVQAALQQQGRDVRFDQLVRAVGQLGQLRMPQPFT